MRIRKRMLRTDRVFSPDLVEAGWKVNLLSYPLVATGFFLLFLIFAFVPGGVSGASDLLRGPDDMMRVVQVLDSDGQSWHDTVQRRLDPPAGVAMHWSRLSDLPLAVAIGALEPFAGRGGAVYLAVLLVPAILGGVFAAVFVWAQRFAIAALRLFEVAPAVAERADVDPRSSGIGVEFQGALIGVHCAFVVDALLLDVEPSAEPTLGLLQVFEAVASGGVRHRLGCRGGGAFEVKQELPGDRLHAHAGQVNRYAAAVGTDLQFGQWLLDTRKRLAQRREGVFDATRGDAILAQLEKRTQSNEIREVKLAPLLAQSVTLPRAQAVLTDLEDASDLRARIAAVDRWETHAKSLAQLQVQAKPSGTPRTEPAAHVGRSPPAVVRFMRRGRVSS